MRVRSSPTFFLFLVLGAQVVIPFLMLFPIQITFAATWRRSRGWLWRLLIVASVLLAALITCPGSPWFQGLETPIPIAEMSFAGSTLQAMEPLLRLQLMLINAAFISLFVCFPVALAATIDGQMRRHKRVEAVEK